MTDTSLHADVASPSPLPADVLLRRELEREFHACELERPFRRQRYDAGHVLDLAVTGVVPAHTGRVELAVERFVGGGFAGQVYRVELRRIEADGPPLAGLQVGQRYAIKILKPPSGFACAFRDLLYFIGYQGPFAAQVNPDALRVGVLWQKFIRRAAARRFGDERAVCDTYATFYDHELHACGEINEWVSGRIWKFEADDEMFERWSFRGDPPADARAPEFIHKKLFMRELVRMLHELGAPEFARQYEWWTCKSQPNAMKRLGLDDDPRAGLTALDFRAGLTLLPFLPMSPADVWLILRGLAQGRLVQFDRSDPPRLEAYVAAHADDFADLQPALEELRRVEPAYRRSLPDVTHHHVRLLTDGALRTSVRTGTVLGWQNLGRIDAEHAERLRVRPLRFTLLWLVALVPLLGKLVLKLWGDARYRRHLGRALTNGRYLWRAWRGDRIEVLIGWHRAGRVADEAALRLVRRPVRYWLQRLALSWLPATWHRAATEPRWAWQHLRARLSFLIQFLTKPPVREEWLLQQIRLGYEEGMLTREEADRIAGHVHDPYIQKYLKCVAAHLCTVPITQIVMLIAFVVVAVYCSTARHMAWPQAAALGTAAAAAIQLAPISPGSISRGIIVIFMMIKDRDVKNYYIAAPISFLHVIGYLAFPLQMIAHNPTLARFLAGRWARSIVHAVPIFGEKGALLEHGVFDAVFNFPLSLRQRLKTRPATTLVWLAAMIALLGVLAYKLLVLAYLAYAFVLRWWS